jgi:hypothetical protein
MWSRRRRPPVGEGRGDRHPVTSRTSIAALESEPKSIVVHCDNRSSAGVWYGGRLYASVLALSAAKAWQESHNREVGDWRPHYSGLWGDE